MVRTCLALCALLFALCLSAHAQQPAKVSRIGYLGGNRLPARAAAFEQGLRELGHVDGKNIVIEYRYAEGKFDRYPALAAELVRLQLDVIVSAGSTATRVVKETTADLRVEQPKIRVGN